MGGFDTRSSDIVGWVRAGLATVYPSTLVDELLEAHREARLNYYLGGLRLNAVEGGRFCEAAFRMLEQASTGTYTPLGTPLQTEKIIAALQNLPSLQYPDSVRLHIPRALRVVYDIRSKRDAAHLGSDIDPNLQDATLVVSAIDWVLAEFVRLHCATSPNDARRVIEDLVTRRPPVIQDFDGFLKVLNPRLASGDFALLLLYHRGATGATAEDLSGWVPPQMRKNLRRTLSRLQHARSFVHFDGRHYFITHAGVREVEDRRLYEVPS